MSLTPPRCRANSTCHRVRVSFPLKEDDMFDVEEFFCQNRRSMTQFVPSNWPTRLSESSADTHRFGVSITAAGVTSCLVMILRVTLSMRALSAVQR
jgi:hypothetical protein